LDSNADVDMNVVMTSDGQFVEVQGTGEESTYSRSQLDELLDLATGAIIQLHDLQKQILASE
jgi:ribonuclease PH